MADSTKTEVNLEVCSGFFRIPTDNLIFNITVLESQESSTTRVVEKIVEVEKEVPAASPEPPPPQPAEQEPAPAPPEAAAPSEPADDFYQKTAEKISSELADLSESLGDDIGGDQAPEGVEDLSAMATDLKDVLLNAKELAANSSGGGGGAVDTSIIKDLADKLAKACELAGGAPNNAASESDPASEEAPAAATQKVTRHLFDIDATFQTMYELCTNETVKTHIKNTREKAGELFNADIFYDEISPKVSGYSEDDGFFNIPMSDIYQSFAKASTDKATINLLKKMDKGQAEIFLDQFLPLEVPPTEEVEVAGDGGEAEAPPEKKEKTPPETSGSSELATLLGECHTLAERAMSGADDEAPADVSGDENPIIDAINDAITITGSIIYDATLLAESGSLTGGDDFESTLWYRIKAASTLYSTMISKKAENAGISFDDALAAGTADIQSLKDQILEKIEAAKPAEPEPADGGDSGEASQDDIDRLLEEMGG